jgi:hypothetical protein
MYRFAGYLIKNPTGDVVQYAPNRAVAEQFAQQHGMSVESIAKAYEWRVGWAESAPQSDSAPEPQIDLPPSQ